MNTIPVAAIQMTSTSDKKENYQKAAHYIQKAAEIGVRLVVLPEHWDWLGKAEEKKRQAEPVDGGSIRFIKDLAKKYQMFIVAGSIAEKNNNNSPFNTSLVVHPNGETGRPYRKMHLFDTDVGGGHWESKSTTAGCDVIVENLGWATIGFSICYDVRFPELFRKLAKEGANILVVVSNFTAVTGPPHWEVLVRARAIENQCFVIASDQTGMTGAGWEAHGHSMIVDPWGEILAMAGREEGLVTAKLDLNKLNDIRAKMPVHRHRKLF